MLQGEREDTVAAVIEAAGGSLTSKVRLQKAVYLLERLGLKSGFEFEYHHYGPYSRDLDNAVADARAFGLVEETIRHRASDGAAFSIFALAKGVKDKTAPLEALTVDRTAKLMREFVRTNVTILELAATVDWLWRFEEIKDWRSEIEKRKGRKTGEGRLDQAVRFLMTLGLEPPSSRGGNTPAAA